MESGVSSHIKALAADWHELETYKTQVRFSANLTEDNYQAERHLHQFSHSQSNSSLKLTLLFHLSNKNLHLP